MFLIYLGVTYYNKKYKKINQKVAYMYKSNIKTDEEKCVGCNKCIVRCPVNANDAKIVDGKNKISINPLRCIQCGECIDVCDHSARSYEDNIEDFLNRLKSGDKISILVAPAIRSNITEYKKLFGFLKHLGVQLIYDVSFGADITTWAYLKAINERKVSTIIAQPCPVIVSYIQHYRPQLIPYLAPIHSPAMCAAIYLKKYKKITDDLAFISPCIGKEMEFSDENTYGYIKYNVTISKLKKYLEDNKINLSGYPSVEFDDEPCGLGFTFSRPGGLRENVEYYTGGKVWVRQVEGIKEVCSYLEQYEARVKNKQKTPLLIDALNCKHGCNLGTAVNNPMEIDDLDDKTNKLKNKFVESHSDPQESILFEMFEKKFLLEDFIRKYTDYSNNVLDASPNEIESIFNQLGKTTEQSRNINCFACGYGGCLKFATAVANGNNDIRNCINYSRTKLKNGKLEFDELFQSLEEKLVQTNDKLQSIKSSAKDLNNIARQTKMISINATIESAHAGVYGKGFSVVSSEIKDLANKSEQIIEYNKENQDSLLKDIQDFEKFVSDIKDKIDKALQ